MRLLALLTCLVVASSAAALAKGPSASATVTVDFTHTVRTVDARTFAINAAVWDGTFAANTTAAAVEPLRLSLFRFPGGSLSDTYHWATNMSDGQTFRWASDFDDFMRTVNALGSSAMITVNYGSGT